MLDDSYFFTTIYRLSVIVITIFMSFNGQLLRSATDPVFVFAIAQLFLAQKATEQVRHCTSTVQK